MKQNHKLNSKLLTGTLWHKRHRPFVNEFNKKVLYLDVDCNELDQLHQNLRLLSHNQFNVYAINDKDHFSHENSGIVDSIRWHLAQEGKFSDDLRLITQPSAYGYVFNPVSFFLTSNMEDKHRIVVAEVHNRIGQRHLYNLSHSSEENGEKIRFQKEFYVSPFLTMDCWYEFTINESTDNIYLGFDEYDSNGLIFQAALNLQPQPLSDFSLVKALFSHPLIPWRTVASIYFQALKLKLRGLPYIQPDSEEQDVDHVAR